VSLLSVAALWSFLRGAVTLSSRLSLGVLQGVKMGQEAKAGALQDRAADWADAT
jgi:hypothetical protein